MLIQDLVHARRAMPGGGQVVILNTGAVIGAEEEAMLQALHSRSIGGIDAHLVKVAQVGAQRFMETTYVGYGHKSIGDCGTITIFIEGISMLGAKAIQDSRLYNGQESSTRYIDFASQPFINPVASSEGSNILENWRAFYLEGLEEMQKTLLERHPQREGEKDAIYQKAIRSRAFDIMRSFLPAGASTNLAWHTELRHADDHLARLRHHPLEEVRKFAIAIEDALNEKFPSTFMKKRYEDTEQYVAAWMRNAYYLKALGTESHYLHVRHDSIDRLYVGEHRELFANRPPLTELPTFLAEAGSMQFEYLLDFGSYRDIQRHRAVIQRMPMITGRYGFNSWYLNVMGDELRQKAESLLYQQLIRIRELATPEVRQYYYPMGTLVPCRTTGDLHALTYLVERRARYDVHPTLRVIAQGFGNILLERFGPLGFLLHMEQGEDRFHYDRGKQDIESIAIG